MGAKDGKRGVTNNPSEISKPPVAPKTGEVLPVPREGLTDQADALAQELTATPPVLPELSEEDKKFVETIRKEQQQRIEAMVRVIEETKRETGVDLKGKLEGKAIPTSNEFSAINEYLFKKLISKYPEASKLQEIFQKIAKEFTQRLKEPNLKTAIEFYLSIEQNEELNAIWRTLNSLMRDDPESMARLSLLLGLNMAYIFGSIEKMKGKEGLEEFQMALWQKTMGEIDDPRFKKFMEKVESEEKRGTLDEARAKELMAEFQAELQADLQAELQKGGKPLADGPAQALTAETGGAAPETPATEQKPKEKTEEEKKDEEQMDDMEQFLHDNPGPMSNFLFAMWRFMKKLKEMGQLFDMPGEFTGSLKSKYEDEKFMERELKELAKRAKLKEDLTLSTLDEAEKDEKKRKIFMERESAKYVCGRLGLSHDFEKEDTAYRLAGKFQNAGDSYKSTNNLAGIKQSKGVPKGTVIFFKIKQEDDGILRSGGTLLCAVATEENKLIFEYWDAEKGEKQTIDLAEEKKSEIIDFGSFMAGFIPRFNTDPEYFKTHEDEFADLNPEMDLSFMGKVQALFDEMKENRELGLERIRALSPYQLSDTITALDKGITDMDAKLTELEGQKDFYPESYIQAVFEKYSEIIYFAEQVCKEINAKENLPEEIDTKLGEIEKKIKTLKEKPGIRDYVVKTERKETAYGAYIDAKDEYEKWEKDDKADYKQVEEKITKAIAAFEKMKEGAPEKTVKEVDAKIKELKGLLEILNKAKPLETK